jgi:UDP-glucose 4-epimerase
MRVLVLGGSGFVGSHVVDALLASGLEVCVFDRNPEHFRPPLPNVTYFRGELGNRGQMEEILSQGMDAVVHMISSTVPKTSNDDPIFDVQMNLVETLALLDLCVKHRIGKVVFTSSGGTVYGNPESLPIAEEHPTNPICSYGVVKLAIEKYLYLYQKIYGLDYVALRLANPYGSRQDPEAIQGVVSVFMGKILRGQEVVIWGDGSVVRDFVHVRDVARAYANALTMNVTGAFNVGSGVGTSITQLIDLMSEELNMSPNIVRLQRRGFDVSQVVLDASKARASLAWSPQVKLEDGIAEVADWMEWYMNLNPRHRLIPTRKKVTA